jgi:hypothetical protein
MAALHSSLRVRALCRWWERAAATGALSVLEPKLTADDLVRIEYAVLAGAMAGERYATSMMVELNTECG